MRPSSQPSYRLLPTAAALLAAFSFVQLTFANPIPKEGLQDNLNDSLLQHAHCASYCGLENELCCSTDQACVTTDGVAACAAVTVTVATMVETIFPRQADSWSLYTSTYTLTTTFTTTGSIAVGAATTGAAATGSCVPQSVGETNCGPICCASDQYCLYNGQCAQNSGATGVATAVTSYSTGLTTMTTAGSTITTQFSAPYRVTGTGATTTSTGTLESATTTGSGNGTAVASGTGGSTLSGGAIAGIVIGVLAGVVILLAVCACCIMRGLWHGVLALLGLGSKKKRGDRETIVVEEERYSRRPSRHGSNSHAARNSHGSWFARDPARSAAGESRRTSEKAKAKDSNQASWWGAGALGTLMLLLGLRRDKKRRSSTAAARRSSRPRSDVSSSYFSDSYTAESPSEFSSDYTYSSVYTPVQSHHPRGASRAPSVVRPPVRTQSVARSASRGAGEDRVYRDEYDPMTKPPPDHAGSASSGGRTRDTRRSRRTETTRISRAQSRR